MDPLQEPEPLIVVDQLTIRNEAGTVVSICYTMQHKLVGQKIYNHDAMDPTITMGLLPEFQHLLTPAEPGAPASEAPQEHTVHTAGRPPCGENGDANSYVLVDQNGRWWMSLLMNGEQVTERQRANSQIPPPNSSALAPCTAGRLWPREAGGTSPTPMPKYAPDAASGVSRGGSNMPSTCLSQRAPPSN